MLYIIQYNITTTINKNKNDNIFKNSKPNVLFSQNFNIGK